MDPTRISGVETIFPMRVADLHAVSDTCMLHVERRKPDQRFLSERRARSDCTASSGSWWPSASSTRATRSYSTRQLSSTRQ